MKFRKKPVVIEATQWFKNGDHPNDNVGEMVFDPITQSNYQRLEGKVVRYFRHPGVPGDTICSQCGHTMHNHGWVNTLEGGHNVCVGDWIITGIKGEVYPCKPGIFAQTYEPVVEYVNTPAAIDGDHGMKKQDPMVHFQGRITSK